MVWYDYIRGFADGQQDSDFEISPNPLLSLCRLAVIVVVFVLMACYALLKAVAGLLWWIATRTITKGR